MLTVIRNHTVTWYYMQGGGVRRISVRGSELTVDLL